MLKKILQITFSIALAVIFCRMAYTQYASLPPDEAELVLQYITVKSYPLWPYFALTYVIFALSVLVRAHRWQIMLGGKGDVAACFRSIAIGYLAQLFVTRVGELIRMANLKKHSDHSLGEIVATAFIDRILDVLALFSMLIFSFVYGKGIISSNFPQLSTLLPSFIALTVVGMCGILFIVLFGTPLGNWVHDTTLFPEIFRRRLGSFIHKFTDGMRFLNSPMKVAYVILSTIFIWGCYAYIFYLTIAFFPAVKDTITYSTSLLTFTCSTLGALIPSPGALGSYHIVASKGMEVILGLSKADAFGLASVAFIINLWSVSLVLGGLSILWQMLGFGSAKGRSGK